MSSALLRLIAMCTPVASRTIDTSVSESPAAIAWRRASGAGCSAAAPWMPRMAWLTQHRLPST